MKIKNPSSLNSKVKVPKDFKSIRPARVVLCWNRQLKDDHQEPPHTHTPRKQHGFYMNRQINMQDVHAVLKQQHMEAKTGQTSLNSPDRVALD